MQVRNSYEFERSCGIKNHISLLSLRFHYLSEEVSKTYSFALIVFLCGCYRWLTGRPHRDLGMLRKVFALRPSPGPVLSLLFTWISKTLSGRGWSNWSCLPSCRKISLLETWRILRENKNVNYVTAIRPMQKCRCNETFSLSIEILARSSPGVAHQRRSRTVDFQFPDRREGMWNERCVSTEIGIL